MPLHVEIRVNANLISRIHIGRLEGSTDPDSINEYVAVIGKEPLRLSDWLEVGVKFTHRYGDGAEVCVQKAIVALSNAGKLAER